MLVEIERIVDWKRGWADSGRNTQTECSLRSKGSWIGRTLERVPVAHRSVVLVEIERIVDWKENRIRGTEEHAAIVLVEIERIVDWKFGVGVGDASQIWVLVEIERIVGWNMELRVVEL